MKNTLRFTALVGVMALTSFLAANPRASAAAPRCGLVNGTACQTQGDFMQCSYAEGDLGGCVCQSTLKWKCFY